MRKDKIEFTEDGEHWSNIKKGTLVSMNCWGFTTEFLKELTLQFSPFLNNIENNPLKAEFFLPFVVDELIKNEKAKVTVLDTNDKWYGVTYQEDKAKVVLAIEEMINQGKYPQKLWN